MSGIEITSDIPIDIEVAGGELPPGVDLPTWLVLAVSGAALKLAHLIVLLHRTPPDRDVTLSVFAALLDVAKTDTVSGYVKELEAAGWLQVDRRRVGGWQVANTYRYRYTPPADHVTPRTVPDLMAIVDARAKKTPDQPVPRSNGVRTPPERGAAGRNPRSTRTPVERAPYPVQTGSYKELTCSSLKDLSIDRAIEDPDPEEPRRTASPEAVAAVRAMDYGRHPVPAEADIALLAGLVDRATVPGRSLEDVVAHCEAAARRATSAVVPYLVGALALDRLPALRVVAATSGLPAAACAACLDDHPAARINVRLRFRDGRMCECHPDNDAYALVATEGQR